MSDTTEIYFRKEIKRLESELSELKDYANVLLVLTKYMLPICPNKARKMSDLEAANEQLQEQIAMVKEWIRSPCRISDAELLKILNEEPNNE